MFRWYVIRTAVGREQKVCRDLKQRISNAGQDRFVREIVVPTETVNETVNGEVKPRTRHVMPGYVLLNIDLPAVHTTVKGTGGVLEFLGAQGDQAPVPLTQMEVDNMLGRRAQAATVKSGPRFAAGDDVAITDGPFSGFNGTVRSCDENGRTVTVEIEIFGRLTPATVSYNQVQAARK